MTLFQRALKREALPTPPVWMMRQAGRYHKHYQALKVKHSFIELCKNPALAAEVAMGPIEDFDFDVSILFSDLLFPLEVLGMPLKYEPGPILGWNLENESQLLGFKKVEEALKGLEFQAEAVRLTRERLPKSKSLIGFVGGPWTLFMYAVDGSHKSSALHSIQEPQLFQKFCEFMTPLLKANIDLQLKAGAEAVMILDTAAGEVSVDFFERYIAPQLKHLAKDQVGYYMKGGTADHYSVIRDFPFAGFGYDHRFDLAKVLKSTQKGFVQGNFHQNFMNGTEAEFEKNFEAFVAPLKKLTLQERAGWVAGLGHGILPQAKEANVRRFVQEIRRIFR